MLFKTIAEGERRGSTLKPAKAAVRLEPRSRETGQWVGNSQDKASSVGASC